MFKANKVLYFLGSLEQQLGNNASEPDNQHDKELTEYGA